ncbi:GMC family oxidoreductase N-terminal domain-containing protein, partial [Candidatus Bathyarchaeota archaeon]|nr:GMC family oxidoreductase N-terminal domain-containing protein [Candidatus Bathyarchaeota archaeon]
GYDGWFETSLTDITLLLEDPALLAVVICAATSMGKSFIGKVITTVTDLVKLLFGDLNNNLRSRDTSEDLFQIPIAVGKANYTRSTPRSFLLEVANDDKYVLDIQLHTLVTKVQFDTSAETPKATGVEFLKGESLYRADPRSAKAAEGTPGSVNALKEVIISGGTFNSPQILMLSGIGPKAELDKAGVPVLVDSPGVGSNLQDHYETATVNIGETPFSLIEGCAFNNGSEEDACLDRWQNQKILPGTYGTNGIPIAMLKRTSVIEDGEPTDLVISGAPGNFRGYYPGFSLDAFAAPNFWTWIILKAHPGNKAGTVTLRSADPRDTPHINFNYYDTGDTDNGIAEKDMQAMYEGMQFARGILDNHIAGKDAFEEIWPGPEYSDEESIKEFLRNEAWGHHASCTVPIGADNDPNAVLDSKMRVRGVTGLRVVDASVMPIIPGTYTAMSTYLISEKAAKDILSQ